MYHHDKEFWAAADKMIEESEAVIDRPKNTAHPRYPELIYPVDYGYLKNTSSMDGGGIDVWLGTNSYKKLVAIICTVDTLKKDSEIKFLIGCTKEETKKIYRLHNQSDYMKGILIERK